MDSFLEGKSRVPGRQIPLCKILFRRFVFDISVLWNCLRGLQLVLLDSLRQLRPRLFAFLRILPQSAFALRL